MQNFKSKTDQCMRYKNKHLSNKNMANDIVHLPNYQIKILFFFKSTIKTFKKQEAKPQGRQRNIQHSCESTGLSFRY